MNLAEKIDKSLGISIVRARDHSSTQFLSRSFTEFSTGCWQVVSNFSRLFFSFQPIGKTC